MDRSIRSRFAAKRSSLLDLHLKSAVVITFPAPTLFSFFPVFNIEGAHLTVDCSSSDYLNKE